MRLARKPSLASQDLSIRLFLLGHPVARLPRRYNLAPREQAAAAVKFARAGIPRGLSVARNHKQRSLISTTLARSLRLPRSRSQVRSNV